MTTIPIRAVALVLLLWTACLSMVASQGLEEALHHHEAGVPCAHALLIDHWFQAAPLTALNLPPPAAMAAVELPVLRRAPHSRPHRAGNRDPPHPS